MISKSKQVIILLAVVTAGFVIFKWKVISSNIELLLRDPCYSPIKYSIGDFDNRFSISRENFISYIKQAESIWENPSKKNLFEYNEDANLKINLIYDYRQESTNKLKDLGLIINDDKSTYDSLKNNYNSLLSSYKTEKGAIEAEINLLNQRSRKYEEDVSFWNQNGGAPRDVYQKLEIERIAINNEIKSINLRSEKINQSADTINSIAVVINQLIDKLNLNVEKYNATGLSAPEEFDEGQYVLENGDERIDIYQFENKNKLIRVLAHEFGHALGLNHVKDSNAIMYKFNQGDKLLATNDDLQELLNICSF